MSTLIQLLDRPIAYNPAFAKLRVGKVRSGPVAAVFLSQLVYWHNRMDGGWMYKTQADIATETALTRDEQETARKRLVLLGVLNEDLRGVPATMHYRINTERLEVLLLETAKTVKKVNKEKTRSRNTQNVETPQSGLVQSRKQECGDAANKNAESQQTRMGDSTEQAGGDPANFPTGDYTENTQESTQDKNTIGQPPAAAARDEGVSEEIHITDQAILVLKHLNLLTGAKYTTAKSTLQNIRARLVDGHSLDELKLVVEYLVDRWLGTEWAKYLNPETMFRPGKFPGNLLAATAWHDGGRKPEQGRTPANNGDRDAAYRRFIGSSLPLQNPGELEQLVRTEASNAGVRGMQPSYSVNAWNRIWADCEQRINGGKAA